jgi:hypothetical protein
MIIAAEAIHATQPRLVVDPQLTARHQAYIECLEATGVTVELARFKKKQFKCIHCGQTIKRFEEKETDVAVASKLLEVCCLGQYAAMIMTGDTDITPAFRTARRLFPNVRIGFLMSYKRHNNNLTKLTPLHFDIPKNTYTKHQLPDLFITPKGKSISKRRSRRRTYMPLASFAASLERFGLAPGHGLCEAKRDCRAFKREIIDILPSPAYIPRALSSLPELTAKRSKGCPVQ